jgi:hypothetical protein
MVALRELIPWRDFVIETSSPPSTCSAELRACMAPPSLFENTVDTLFVGESRSETEFRLSRRIDYRNSFIPIIVATIEPSAGGGSRVHVRMQLHPLAIVFMTIWMAGTLLAGLGGLVLFAGGLRAGFAMVALPAFGAALVTLPFGFEARKAETLLRLLFEPSLPDKAPDR